MVSNPTCKIWICLIKLFLVPWVSQSAMSGNWGLLGPGCLGQVLWATSWTAICRQTENSRLARCLRHWAEQWSEGLLKSTDKYLHRLMTRHLACSHTDLLSEFCKGQAINIKHQHCYPWWLDTQADTRVSRGQHGDGSGVQSQLAQFLKNAQDSLETIETFKQWPILQSGNSKTFYQYNWIQIRFAFFFKHCQILTIPKGEITANRRQRLDLVQHLLYLTLC